MTSKITRDELEAALWALPAQRSPWQVEKILRMIDQYAISNGRRWAEKYPAIEGSTDPVR